MLTLDNLRLIDGTGHDPIDKATIIIDGSIIKRIGTEISDADKTNTIDLNGFTVLPGLIDCHIHLGGLTVDEPGGEIGKVTMINMVSFFWDYMRNYAHRRRLAIENGVTVIRSAGDHYPHIIRLRDKIASNQLSGPRIFAPGPTITAPGGHPAGTIYKGNRYIIENAVRQISDVNNARSEVRRLVEGGVDCIKAIYSDINPMDITRKVPRLSFDVLQALADETHRYNRRLMVHTGSLEETADVVTAGADSIEHGILPGSDSNEFDDNLVRMMKEKGTYFVPTLAIAWAYKELYPDVFVGLKRTVKKLHDGGVNLAAGTDSGTPGVVIGKGLHKELELMVEAGLTPMEAIIAGTSKAADNLARRSEFGTLEQGKIADIIAVSRDPLKDIKATREVKLVIKDGKVLVNRIKKTSR